jgi:O-antigen ligase
LRLPRALGVVALVSVGLGTVIAGAMASALGVASALAAVAVVALARRELDLRRAAATALAALVALAGVVVIRGHDLSAFARFLGASPTTQHDEEHVQTYAHHTLLVWFGYRIWKDHPLLGVGWEGSNVPANYLRYLPDAHRRFPAEAPLAFPGAAPTRRYGVQNVWVQALADLGVVGLLLWVGVFVAGAWLAIRRNALLALSWIALVAWLWSAQGFVAGIPLAALTWIAFGLAVARTEPE